MDASQYVIFGITFASVVVTVVLGIALFREGWESYEQRYIKVTSASLESLLLTIPPQQLLYLSVVSVFLVFVVVFLLLESAVIAGILGALGFFVPRVILKVMRQRRTRKFNDQLVDALTTLNNAMRSGFSLPKAFELIAKDAPRPLSQEFGILVQELRLGATNGEGLRHMLERVPVEDLNLLTTAVEISAAVGGNLTEVFDRISHTIRERHRIEGRIDALTAQGKMQGITVGLLPIFMAMAYQYVDPDLLVPLYTTTEGYIVVAIMVILEFLGFFFIRRITSIEV